MLAKDTVVARMSRFVEEASSRKSKAQRFIDNFAKYYIPGMYHVHHQLSSSFEVRENNFSTSFSSSVYVVLQRLC